MTRKQTMCRASRADDEQVLAILAARLAMPTAEVGMQFGRTSAGIRTITNRVRDADFAASDEPAEAMAPFYDWSV